MRRRLLAIFLTLTMALAVFPASALATGDDPDTGEPSEDISTCTCTELCTADAVNSECPVCAENYSACEGSAPEETGDEPTEEPGEPQQPENTLTEESTQVELLQARIDALPTVEELSAMGAEERDAAYQEAISIDDAIRELPGEEQALLVTDKLDAIFDWLNVQTAPQPDNANDPAGEEGTENNPWDISAEGEENNVTAYLTQNNEDDENPTYTLTISGEGAMKSFETTPEDKGKYRPWIDHVEEITQLVIKDGITEICERAFNNCKNITGDVHLPDSVRKIGAYAFKGCTGITSINLSNVTSVGVESFCNCSGLITITMPEYLEDPELPDSVFSGLSAMTSDLEIPEGVTSVGNGAFSSWGANANKSVNIVWNDGITTIGASAFYSVKTETLTIPASVISIGKDAFNAIEATSLQFSEGSLLQSIGPSAFYNASLEGTVTLPASVTAIDTGAFRGTNITGLSFEENSQMKEIGESAFFQVDTLTAIISLPDSVTTIGKSAFSQTGITGLTISSESELTSIGEQAFYQCSSLSGSVYIPGSVETVSASAFAQTGIEVLTLGHGMVSIAEKAFSNTNALKSVSFPATLKTIGESAFYASGLSVIILPEGVQTLGNSAFYSNNTKHAVFIPASVDNMGLLTKWDILR